MLRSARTWRAVAWLSFRALAGLLVLVGPTASALAVVALLLVPFRDGYLGWETWRSTAGWVSAWTVPVGLALLVASIHLIAPLAAIQSLGPGPDEQLFVLERSVPGPKSAGASPATCTTVSATP